MATAFDVKPFPKPMPALVAVGHNKPPLDEATIADFNEALATDGLIARIDALVAKGSVAGPCADDDTAGRYADFVKLCKAAGSAVEEEREKLNRPLLTAQRGLKARSEAVTAPLLAAMNKVRGHIDTYASEQRRIAAEKQRQADEAARKAREDADRAAAEAEAAGRPVEAAPIVIVEAAPVAAPVIQGDYGAKVGTTTDWKHEIESVRKLPDAILKHEKVVDAINKVIAAQVKGGLREMKGVRIWSVEKTVIR